MPRPNKNRLGEILVTQALITNEQLNAALLEQKASGRRLGRIFVEKGLASEVEISSAIGRQLQIPFIDLKYFNIDPDAANRLPESQARRFRALVLEDEKTTGGMLRVGMADPTDLYAYDELARFLKCDFNLAVVSETALLQAIDRLYRRTEEISGFAQELEAELGDAILDFGAIAMTPGLEEAPVVKLLQSVFEDAIRVRASDIHIEPQDSRVQIRFRIDGVLHLQTEADMKISPALVLRLKLSSGLDISEKRLPQDGRFNVKVRGQAIDVRISTMPTQHGESVVLRLLTQNTTLFGLDHLGIPHDILQKLREVIQLPSGMVLVTGPTGSGKTTTLYAALSEINRLEKKIVTVEDPVEYRLDGISQVQVHDKIGLSFDRVLRSTLRHDPDVILVGEMRDSVTAEIGLRAAMTGHLVLSTLHTNDAISTPIRLRDMGVPRYMVAMSLELVIAQRLVRLVCESCKSEQRLSAQEHEWLHMVTGLHLDHLKYFSGSGCTQCNGTGYFGRTGVYEMLEMNKSIVEAANQENPLLFRSAARAQMQSKTLRQHAAELVQQGRTTAFEAMRISSQADED